MQQYPLSHLSEEFNIDISSRAKSFRHCSHPDKSIGPYQQQENTGALLTGVAVVLSVLQGGIQPSAGRPFLIR